MPDNTVYVGRPTKWGNPIKAADGCTRKAATKAYREIVASEKGAYNVNYFLTHSYPATKAVRDHVVSHIHELRGKNLACWCPLDEPCHADVLLAMANPYTGLDEIITTGHIDA